MSEMVERCTDAAIERWMENAPRGTTADRLYWAEMVRVIIAAMREPTAAMIAAGRPVVYDCYSLEPGEGLDENPAVPTWEAMIDAALK